MLLQSTRAKLMEAQLGTQIKAMQERNAQITKLNNDLTVKQQELAGFSGTDTSDAKKAKTKEVGDLKTAIDSLNSDLQIDMIRTQSLVNKRNEAFDTLTNLLGSSRRRSTASSATTARGATEGDRTMATEQEIEATQKLSRELECPGRAARAAGAGFLKSSDARLRGRRQGDRASGRADPPEGACPLA